MKYDIEGQKERRAGTEEAMRRRRKSETKGAMSGSKVFGASEKRSKLE